MIEPRANIVHTSEHFAARNGPAFRFGSPNTPQKAKLAKQSSIPNCHRRPGEPTIPSDLAAPRRFIMSVRT
jgi:hypothetical protein